MLLDTLSSWWSQRRRTISMEPFWFTQPTVMMRFAVWCGVPSHLRTVFDTCHAGPILLPVLCPIPHGSLVRCQAALMSWHCHVLSPIFVQLQGSQVLVVVLKDIRTSPFAMFRSDSHRRNQQHSRYSVIRYSVTIILHGSYNLTFSDLIMDHKNVWMQTLALNLIIN